MMFTNNCVLLVIVLTSWDAVAYPATPNGRGGSITLPLHRVQHSRPDVHPQLVLQQYINRSQRRRARMNRHAGPSDEELATNLAKRMGALTDSGLSKRSHTHGAPMAVLSKPKHADARPPTANNSLGLDIEGADLGYFAAIQIGTPPRDFRVTMDSGSSDLWVGGEGCKAKHGHRNCGSNHRFLGPESSSTFVDTKKRWDITYGSGSVSGNIVTDNVVIAGLSLNEHTFGVARRESSDFYDDSVPYDGLMGLALTSLSNQKTITPVEAMAKNGLINEAITSYRISRAADSKDDGEITFGALDNNKFDADTLVTLDNVSEDGFWEANVGTVSVNGIDMRFERRTAILDTGTTLILAPPKDAEMIHAAIQGAKPDGLGGFTVPCATTASVALTFGNTVFAIDPRDLAAEPVNEDEPDGDCLSGIVADTEYDDGPRQWLLGDVFLKNAYFSTNANRNTISLARPV